MQFVKNGPDIPEHLIQAHEEGRVIFFCGAGISYPAGLPGFGGLVDKLYAGLGVAVTGIESAAVAEGRYDTTIGLLESRFPGGRKAVREQLAQVLTPDLTSRPHAARTHEALLNLSRSRKGQYRLVTTNFDRLFEKVIAENGIDTSRFKAPFLPVPKNRWNGLVYLHGLLAEHPTEEDLNRLVVSSGDFGLAYLSERWAARFVAELFRGYTVCFVGYSINDPVLRYMMDALAADRLMGEAPTEAFAFGSFKRTKRAAAEQEWKSKNVTPILYPETSKHTHLHRTLRVWAETYRDGSRGREAIVTRYAMTVPTGSTAQDDFVGRMLWALSDETGLPAKRFAEFDPVPPLEWLEALADRRFGYRDLPRFRVQPNAEKDEKLTFSLAIRPSPYTHAPWMAPVLSCGIAGQWDNVMEQIARWLARHLDDPKLLLWIATYGGLLHPRFLGIVSRSIAERQKSGHPLSSPMQRLWRVTLAGRLQSSRHDHDDLYSWIADFVRDGLSPSLKWRLRRALAPYIEISEPFRYSLEESDSKEDHAADDRRVSDLVRWEIVLAAKYVHSALKTLSGNELWYEALSQLLPDLTVLLKDALDLMRELEGADDHHDNSYISQPSISPHEQNRDFHDWTALIDLVRDSWLAAVENQPEIARNEARRWIAIPYPLFRRLAFFAAAQRPDILPPDESIPWLLADDRYWLWAVETQREAIRFLVALASTATHEQNNTLQLVILQGPPRQLFRDDIEPDRLQSIIDRETCLRLAKFQAGGASLTPDASARLQIFRQQHPQWQLASDERDEFSFWMGNDDELRTFQPTPKSRRDLEAWLKDNPTTDDWQRGDDWSDRCASDFPRTAAALFGLARQGIWLVDRWRQAFQAWATEKFHKRSWKYASRVLAEIPGDKLKELARPVSWWLESIAKNLVGNKTAFFSLIRRILDSQRNEPINLSDDVVFHAINHPVGLVTGAALRWWYRQNLQDAQGLEQEIASLFTNICDPNSVGLRYGCIVLAGNVISLFRVDRAWTEQNLLRYFDWERDPNVARGIWQSFLHSPRLYWPLLDALKASFITTARNYTDLGETHGRQYVAFFTYAALSPERTYRDQDFKAVFASLPPAALAQSAETLFRALQGAAEHRSEYLRNRVDPFIKLFWPKTQEARTPEVSKYFAKLCAVSGEAFPVATSLFRDWLQPISDANYTIHLLQESGSCALFPGEALGFLARIIPDDVPWLPQELRSCLDAIRSSQPDLVADQRYQRLDTLLRQHEQ